MTSKDIAEMQILNGTPTIKDLESFAVGLSLIKATLTVLEDSKRSPLALMAEDNQQILSMTFGQFDLVRQAEHRRQMVARRNLREQYRYRWAA
ncbi:MAG: hypothetical protein ABIG32_01710 [Candidatus Uhrbacteria bacterium]|nr:hypothetical protein [Patescibacteria group bacterium]MBU1906985.1 hypothetical protein [Patescibacteria group bacterium]